jgi:AraC-like DNA-binding protein
MALVSTGGTPSRYQNRAQSAADTIVSKTRATAPGLRVADAVCSAHRGTRSEEEESAGWTLVLPYRGVFVWEVEDQRITADANSVILFAPGQPHRVFHPAHGGDACIAIGLSDDWAEWITPAGSRIRQHWILDGASQRSVHHVAHHLDTNADCIAAEEAVAFVVGKLTCSVERSTRHGALVDAVRERLASDPSGNVTLARLAAEGGVSRFELARRFRAHTGSSIHEYLVRLRLISALNRLREGEADLTRLAIDSGFSSHAHFTSAFTKAFGKPPSAVRIPKGRP